MAKRDDMGVSGSKYVQNFNAPLKAKAIAPAMSKKPKMVISSTTIVVPRVKSTAPAKKVKASIKKPTKNALTRGAQTPYYTLTLNQDKRLAPYPDEAISGMREKKPRGAFTLRTVADKAGEMEKIRYSGSTHERPPAPPKEPTGARENALRLRASAAKMAKAEGYRPNQMKSGGKVRGNGMARVATKGKIC